MSDELVFYTNPQSRGRTIRWMLEEIGEPYRTEIMGYGSDLKSERYLAINPMGKVPAITHKGDVVTECAAICAYLADAFPSAGLAPPHASRARYYRWLFFAAGPIEAAITNVALNVQVLQEQEAMVGYGTLERVLESVEGALNEREWIASDHFSAADVYVGAVLNFGLQFGMIASRPSFSTYVARLQARPAFLRASELDAKALGTLTA